MSPSFEAEQQLRRTWAPARGFPGVLSEVNNQLIGVRFMVTAFLFFLIGGVLALLMRIQLTVAENDFLGPQVFNELFTMHGSTMMFLFAVPFLEGLALYLLPLMIGARDVAFPRLTAFGYWVYLFGGLLFYASFLFGSVPDVGWFGYTPLSTSRFTGVSTDFWLLGLSLVEVAGLTAAVEIVVTILKFRAPGMTLGRMPLFVLTLLVVGVMILVAFTVLLTATVLLELDRVFDTAIFDVQRGGSDLLWQHLFWFFGHPEVYIMFLPASGIISMVIPAFSRRPVVGYVLIAVAILVTGFVSFGLWVHHMFATGLPDLSMAFFTGASLMIAIASGVQVFAWIATLWGSGPELKAPLCFALGFVFLFVLGGLTGVMVAVVPFDQQVHDTYFVVAHFHYVLIGGVLFPIFAGLYYWLPKVTGRKMHEQLGRWSFLAMFLGFNITFFPMHIMGFLGLPRRVYTYRPELELDGYNMVTTTGAGLLGMGVLLFLVDVAYSLRRGQRSGNNPWNADSLEWASASPPLSYSFVDFPVVGGRHPLWEPEAASELEAVRDLRRQLSAEPQHWRGTLVTDATDTRPQAIQFLPSPTYIPFWTAAATLAAAAGVLAQSYILASVAVLILVVCVANWLRPHRVTLRMLERSDLAERTGLPVIPTGTASVGWWGMLGLLTIIGSSFAALIYSYFYIRLFSEQWPSQGLKPPDLLPGAVAVAAVLGGALVQRWGFRQLHAGSIQRVGASFSVTAGAGLAYLAAQFWDWSHLGFVPQTSAYASLVFVIGGAMSILISVGIAFAIAGQWRLLWGGPPVLAHLRLHMEVSRLYWSFAVVIAVVVFATLSLSPLFL